MLVMLKDNNNILSLEGKWDFYMGNYEEGKKAKDTIILSGTMDLAGKGIKNTSETTSYLSRKNTYIGACVYRKKVRIPREWDGKNITLFLERTKKSSVWIDDVLVGTCKSLTTSHIYDITNYLTPSSTHTITIEVDNSPKDMPATIFRGIAEDTSWIHQVSDFTQTNWNGIVGRIELQQENLFKIEDIKVRPNLENKTAYVKILLSKESVHQKGNIEVSASLVADKKICLDSISTFFNIYESNEILINYYMGEDVKLWDEFEPNLYCLDVKLIVDDAVISEKQVVFGMREFKKDKTQFKVNGKIILLRGEVNCAAFPRTGHAPMSVDEWLLIMDTYKDYGLNHVRFHSWIPPEAAFVAADLRGLYLNIEFPLWDSDPFGKKDVYPYMQEEYKRIATQYGNHPSFVMFTLGNEFGEVGRENSYEFIRFCKSIEPNILYCEQAGFPDPKGEEDYFVIADYGGHAFRGSILPYTNWDYGSFVKNNNLAIPPIAHEIGQYQVYPDYDKELPKYKGFLEPRNLIEFKKRLEKNNMGDLASDFNLASGKLASILYKSEIEAYMRTPDIGGFQLLQLQDFPGQGTALVGMLDVFMDSKGLITPQEYRQFCSSVVTTALLPKYIWKNSEVFNSQVSIANYGSSDISNILVSWELLDDAFVIACGNIESVNIKQGSVKKVGKIETKLNNILSPKCLELRISISDTEYMNGYSIWVYPDIEIEKPKNVIVARSFNKSVEKVLEEGGKVLLIPEIINNALVDKEKLPYSKQGRFPCDFWSPMFHQKENDGYTLGLLIDKEHKVFQSFPTEMHSDWQWYDIVINSRYIVLDDAPVNFRPIVQAIPAIDQNHKLGMLFEAKVLNGSLMVCSSDLLKDKNNIALKQLYFSIIEYMESDEYKPTNVLSADYIKKLVPPDEITHIGIELNKILNANSVIASSYDPNYPVANILDDNLSTIWHTKWTPKSDPLPHTLIMDFGKEEHLNKLVYVPRQDVANAYITEFTLYTSENGVEYKKICEGKWPPNSLTKSFNFNETARFVKIEITKGTNNEEFVAASRICCEYTQDSNISIGSNVRLFVKSYSLQKPELIQPDKLSYTSDNYEIISVNEEGVVTALNKGTATVTVKYVHEGKEFSNNILFTVD